MRDQDPGIQILPDIEMYGGDTTPWEYQLKHTDGSYYSLSEAAGYTGHLYIIPYYMQTGVGVNGTPILNKTAAVRENRGVATAIFEFTSTDTINIAGKYIYQLEFTYGSGKRIGQGNLYIRPNINQ